MAKSSHSQVESFLLCERRHYYGYGYPWPENTDELGLNSKSVSDALYFGNCGHAGLQKYYEVLKLGWGWEAASQNGLEAAQFEGKNYKNFNSRKLDTSVALTLCDYFDEYKERDTALEVLEVELDLQVELLPGYLFHFKVDLIVREPGVGVVAYDHKFQADFFNPDIVDLNPQLPKYLHACRAAGYNVQKVGYNEIRTRSTIENKADRSKLFRRTIVPLSPTRVKTTIREQLLAHKRIDDLKALGSEEWERRVLRTANKMVCSHCSFKDLCAADLNGYDTNLLVTTDYTSKVNR